MTSYEIIVYAPGTPPQTVHMGTSEADMHSHLNAVEGTLQTTCATAHIEISTSRRSRWISYHQGCASRVRYPRRRRANDDRPR
jgi:hypothetical protein